MTPLGVSKASGAEHTLPILTTILKCTQFTSKCTHSLMHLFIHSPKYNIYWESVKIFENIKIHWNAAYLSASCCPSGTSRLIFLLLVLFLLLSFITQDSAKVLLSLRVLQISLWFSFIRAPFACTIATHLLSLKEWLSVLFPNSVHLKNRHILLHLFSYCHETWLRYGHFVRDKGLVHISNVLAG